MTVQNLVDDIRREYAKGVPDAEIMYYLQEVHTDIITSIRLNVEDVTISLTDGTKGYAIDDDILKIWSAKYYRSAADAYGLKATHLDELNSDNPHWVITPDMEPRSFYIEQGFIYFHPTPPTTTASGYPKVVLTVTRDVTLTLSPGDELPGYVRSGGAWIEATKQAIASSKQDWDAYAVFKANAEKELVNLKNMVVGRNVEFNPSIRPRRTLWGGTKR